MPKVTKNENKRANRSTLQKGGATSRTQPEKPKKETIIREKTPQIVPKNVLSYETEKAKSGGKKDRYWDRKGFMDFSSNLRKGKPLPAGYFPDNYMSIADRYGINSWEFGNWTTQEARMNYIQAIGLSLYDIEQITGFSPKQVGLSGKLKMSIGARGQGRALAHFEPSTFVINLTRYARMPGKTWDRNRLAAKNQALFATSGGAGSLAHEYGHALDYFYGGYVEQDRDEFALTCGDSTRAKINRDLADQNNMRGCMERLLASIQLNPDGSPSDYRKGIAEYANETFSDYVIRRNEVFARAFEQWTEYVMAQKGYYNIFLSKYKYDSLWYVPAKDFLRAIPHFTELMKRFRGEKVTRPQKSPVK